MTRTFCDHPARRTSCERRNMGPLRSAVFGRTFEKTGSANEVGTAAFFGRQCQRRSCEKSAATKGRLSSGEAGPEEAGRQPNNRLFFRQVVRRRQGQPIPTCGRPDHRSRTPPRPQERRLQPGQVSLQLPC